MSVKRMIDINKTTINTSHPIVYCTLKWHINNLSLYIGVQSSSWKISAEGHIAVGTVVRDHLHAVYAERYEAATQETETSTEYTQETDSSTGCPGYHIILRHSPGVGGRWELQLNAQIFTWWWCSPDNADRQCWRVCDGRYYVPRVALWPPRDGVWSI